MNLTQRFSLIMKTSVSALFETFEDPERCLHQLILDMEEELESAKRAVAKAMANEEMLRKRIAFQEKEARQWQESAERFLEKDNEPKAKDALRRAETAERLCSTLREQLSGQEKETADVRDAIVRMNERVEQARARLHLLQAKMRQGEARRAIRTALRTAEKRNLHADFDRIGNRIESQAATESAYLRIDDELRGEDLRRERESEAVEDAVNERLESLKELRASKRNQSKK